MRIVTIQKIFIVSLATATITSAGCTVIAPLFWPTFNGANKMNKFAPGPTPHGSALSEASSDAVSDAADILYPNQRTGLWGFVTRHYKAIAIIGFICWLLGLSGMAWAWRNARYALGQVVQGAEYLKEQVQDHVDKQSANRILSGAQDNWVQKKVSKLKKKLNM